MRKNTIVHVSEPLFRLRKTQLFTTAHFQIIVDFHSTSGNKVFSRKNFMSKWHCAWNNWLKLRALNTSVYVSLQKYELFRYRDSVFTFLNLDFSVEDSKYLVIHKSVIQVSIEYHLSVMDFEWCFLKWMVKAHEYSNKCHITQDLVSTRSCLSSVISKCMIHSSLHQLSLLE